ncbi:ubiquitin elongating factor core-domain-containing protein [Geranomyces variabilis]|nr:ubiquitin elongating factor core-domain-containing protein [Geranomyces variabilis]
MDEDAERIRKKRLAKLSSSVSVEGATGGAAVASNPTSPAPTATAPSPAASTPRKVVEPAAKPAAQAASPKPSPKPSPSASHARLAQRFSAQSDAEWEGEAFQHVFQCCFDTETADRKSLTYLAEVHTEMEAEGLPLLITAGQIERVLYARLSLESNASPEAVPLFDYLLDAWKRGNDVRAKTLMIVEKAGGGPELNELVQRRLATLQTAQVLIMNYCGLVIHPDMSSSFPQPNSVLEEGPSCIARKLLQINVDEAENAMPRKFLENFVNRFNQDGLPEYLEFIARSLSAHMRLQNIMKDYNTPLRVLQLLISFQPIAATLPSLLIWNPSAAPKTIELLSFLGPFFSRVSSFPDADPAVAEHHFGSGNAFAEGTNRMSDGFLIGTRNAGNVKAAMTSLRGLMEKTQARLHDIVMSIIKASPAAREGVLQYFATAVNINRKRGRMQVDPREVSSDGYIYNLMQVGLRLADPLMDLKYSKLHLIDPDYFNYSSRVDIADDTRINADKKHYEQYTNEWKSRNPNPPAAHFVADVFFLTLALHHYGLISIIRTSGQQTKHIEELRKHVSKLKAERDSGAWPPQARVVNETMLKRFEVEYDKRISYKLATDTALRNWGDLQHSMKFYDLVMMWLLRCTVLDQPSVHHPASKSGDSVDWGRVARGDTQELPLSNLPLSPPMAFATLPEWIIEDICDFYIFVVRNEMPMLEGTARDALLTFTMTFLANPQYIKNPHLKSKFVEILFTFTWPMWRSASGQNSGSLDGVFCTHPLAKQLLVSNLMKFYVDAEHTGAHSQFYDKFSIRYNISQVLKSVWSDRGHQMQVVLLSQNTDFFVSFAALLIYDTTYLLDEALDKLKKIQQLQTELAESLPPNSSQEDQERREEKIATLKQLEGGANSYMSLGNETVHMLQYMTHNQAIVQGFMEREIINKLANMLNYVLAAMVGPKCTDLKVKNPEKYRFDPKRLLNELAEIFINLSRRDEFVIAVAKDQRSYKKDHFVRAKGILIKNMLKNEYDMQPLDEFVAKVESSIRSTMAEEELLGDVPPDFEDPIMATLMEDPVILPSSGTSIDRSTIKELLLSDPHDPVNRARLAVNLTIELTHVFLFQFNRQPLKIEDVVPNDDLRIRIEEWKRSKLQTRDTNAVTTPMDLS